MVQVVHSYNLLTQYTLYMVRVSADFNAPNKEQVFEFMDKAILNAGVNLIDTVSDGSLNRSYIMFIVYMIVAVSRVLHIIELQFIYSRQNNIQYPVMATRVILN